MQVFLWSNSVSWFPLLTSWWNNFLPKTRFKKDQESIRHENQRAWCHVRQRRINLSHHFRSGHFLVLQMGRQKPENWGGLGRAPQLVRLERTPLLCSSLYLLPPKHIENCRESASRDSIFLFNVQNGTCTLKESYPRASLINRTELWCQGRELMLYVQRLRNNGLLVGEKRKTSTLQPL